MNNWIGKRLGKVQIESLIGRGGVAEVYVGTHTTLQRKVAVKILRNQSEDNTDALARFEREAQVIARFRHPNIVQVHDFDTVENDPYLVMEYIEGPTLQKYLHALHQNNQRIPFPQVVRLVNAVASALQYAHNRGVIHRDVKPGNILLISPTSLVVVGRPLPEDFEPVLTDFGLVRFLDSSHQTTTGRISGTPAYMSPEQARGDSTDARTDVYSLGIVLYEILAGHIPFDGESTVSILLKQVNEPPPPIPGISPLIEQVLQRALAKDLQDRYQTPIELANAFSLAVDTSTNLSTVQRDRYPDIFPTLKTEVPANKQATTSANRQWLRIGLLTLLALALGGYLFFNNLPSASLGDIPSLTSSITDTVPVPTDTAAPTNVLLLGPTGILRFENGSAVGDQVTLIAEAMPAPPVGSQYQVWLSNTDERLPLGVFSPDETGKGELTFSEPEGANLLALYDKVEVTIEPDPDTDPDPSELVAYSFSFPSEALIHTRYLLSAVPNTPDGVGLIQGLYSDIQQIDQLVHEMQASFENGDKASTQQKAEGALNLLVGAQSADYKDWNEDGLIEPKESYGLLLNGSNFGYIRATYAEADYIGNTSGATRYMITNGDVVKTCAQNLASWASQLRDELRIVLTSTSDAEISAAANEAVALADQMLNGADPDNNGTVDTTAGECGAQVAYEYAYYMADMPLLPTSPSYQLTAEVNLTPSRIFVTPTRTRSTIPNTGGSGSQVTQAPAQATQAPVQATQPPANQPQNTPKPKNTKKPPDNTPSNPNPPQPGKTKENKKP